MKRREREGKKKEWALFALHLHTHTHTKFTCIVGERVTLRDREGEGRGGKEKVHLSLFAIQDKRQGNESGGKRKKEKKKGIFLPL